MATNQTVSDVMSGGVNITTTNQTNSHIYTKMMKLYTVYSYLETAIHVSGGTSTHHQERIQLYLQHLVLVTPLLLHAAIAAGSSNGVTNNRCCRYRFMRF
jgi:hypothetical protein